LPTIGFLPTHHNGSGFINCSTLRSPPAIPGSIFALIPVKSLVEAMDDGMAQGAERGSGAPRMSKKVVEAGNTPYSFN
jgi:hypothetical protein